MLTPRRGVAILSVMEKITELTLLLFIFALTGYVQKSEIRYGERMDLPDSEAFVVDTEVAKSIALSVWNDGLYNDLQERFLEFRDQ